MIKIYNTIKRKKEKFKITNNKINMYVCGVTVYNLCHIGHARTFIIFDIIARYFKYCGYKLNYIRNITDIDDKIIDTSKKNNESIKQFTSKMIKNMNEDFSNLDLIIPDHEPKVTNHINEIIHMIKKLISMNFAYVSKNGDVMFSIKSFKDYGKLSLQNITALKQKTNINKKKEKKDFVLWKVSKKEEEPNWFSPWGNGRPGWHIECSAISYKYLGNCIDIHGGGTDLIFPHHENEFAQSFCANKQLVNCWMHTGMINTNNGKKMSKSLNNFFTIKDILKKFDPEVIRYFLISSHYRSTINFNKSNLNQAKCSLESLYNSLIDTDNSFIAFNDLENNNFENSFKKAMNNDFNTPVVCSIFFKMMHKINKLKLKKNKLANNLAAKLRELGQTIGLFKKDPELFFKKKLNDKKTKKIDLLIKNRLKAREQKEWDKADKIRNKLKSMGVILEDNFHKTIWKNQ